MKKQMFAGCLALGLVIAGCSQNTAENNETNIETSHSVEETTPEVTAAESKEEAKEVVLRIKNPSWEYYCKEDPEADPESVIRLEKQKEEANNITDTDIWAQKNELSIPQIPYCDETYFYDYPGEPYAATELLIRDVSDDEKIYTIDFTDFSMPDEYNEEYAEFLNESIRYAMIQDQVLYVATGHNTYSEWAPHTGYMTAVDLERGEVLWKSEPQTCNSHNFEIIGDSIVCGYGFTNENDYLYVLNKTDGRRIERIPVVSAVDYIVRKDDTLYVRTYNTDYEFSVLD